jgi:hypothetical protein
MDTQDLLRRALAAYFRTGGTDQPANTSDVAQHAGLRYVVLRNVRGPLAIYRVKNDGMLRRLKRWPAAVAL